MQTKLTMFFLVCTETEKLYICIKWKRLSVDKNPKNPSRLQKLDIYWKLFFAIQHKRTRLIPKPPRKIAVNVSNSYLLAIMNKMLFQDYKYMKKSAGLFIAKWKYVSLYDKYSKNRAKNLRQTKYLSLFKIKVCRALKKISAHIHFKWSICSRFCLT